jgi:hypothetical protein
MAPEAPTLKRAAPPASRQRQSPLAQRAVTVLGEDDGPRLLRELKQAYLSTGRPPKGFEAFVSDILRNCSQFVGTRRRLRYVRGAIRNISPSQADEEQTEEDLRDLLFEDLTTEEVDELRRMVGELRKSALRKLQDKLGGKTFDTLYARLWAVLCTRYRNDGDRIHARLERIASAALARELGPFATANYLKTVIRNEHADARQGKVKRQAS